MSDAKILGEVETPLDIDPAETNEWLGSLDYVLKSRGPDRVRYIVKALENRAREEGLPPCARGRIQAHR